MLSGNSPMPDDLAVGTHRDRKFAADIRTAAYSNIVPKVSRSERGGWKIQNLNMLSLCL